jgi:NitT/TauT family transport system permease protein
MNASHRGWSFFRSVAALALLAGAYELLARSGAFPSALMPTLPAVASALWKGLADGTLPGHAASTLHRVLVGMGLAVVLGVPLGILMGRVRAVERFVLPLASALMPIPSLAWVPVFILWFGLGNATAIGVVLYAALFPVLLNVWSGVRAVNPLWLRAASAMGAGTAGLFWRVILPGSSPFIVAGLRQAFVRAWVAVVGAEMLAASDWGLGWVIFDAKEFLRADVMLASLAIIGLIGLAFERFVFGTLERVTVRRWGMLRDGKG